MAKAKAEKVEGAEDAPVTTITLAEICAEMGIKTTSARIKLRKKMAGDREASARWTFPIEQKDEIVALLTPTVKSEPAEAEDGDGEDVE